MLVTLLAPALAITTTLQSGGITTTLAPPSNSLVTMVSGGVKGDKGDAGAGGDHLQHDQTVAASTWTINHNFGARPNVSVYSTGGNEMWAEILHTSLNQTQILFDAPTAGFAILS